MKIIQTGFLVAAVLVVAPTLGHADKIVRPDRSTVILQGPAESQPEAADNGRGIAFLGGLIGTDGSVTNNAGITSVDHPLTGLYVVNFDRNVLDCSYAAIVHGFALGFVRIVARAATQIQFNTNRSSDGALTNIPFSLIVFCPK
jgi:hypothetical protein